MINVTKANLPPLEMYNRYLERIWASGWLTNQGPLLLELENGLKDYLDVNYFQFVTNGTIALQLPLRALDLTGEIITTPFSYVATTTSILWEHLTPVYADILPDTLCIDPDSIEQRITDKTTAILATHVYGIPCQIDRIADIAKKYNLKVIYDGAHAFGVKWKGQSIFKFGDVTTLSFHATKLFHTIEGGGIVCNNALLNDKIHLYKTFGHYMDDYFTMGINGKNSEFHAAMGLCNLPYVNEFIELRKKRYFLYRERLDCLDITFPIIDSSVDYNYSYFPIVLSNERKLLQLKATLAENGINTRRYFYPSLNTLPYVNSQYCPVSENISLRVLCLPMYQDLLESDVDLISTLIVNNL